jgi:hypothetical protein
MSVLAATACTKYYRPPASPQAQLAVLKADTRATVLEVDGLPIKAGRGVYSADEFGIASGCRTLLAKYEDSFFIWGEKRARRKGLGTGLLPVLSETEAHNYETTEPIRFFIPVKGGHRYWITATFTGDEFLPRVVELDQNGDTVNRFFPDRPCPQ